MVEISAALPLEVVRQSFSTQMHQRVYQTDWAMRGWVIDDLTNFLSPFLLHKSIFCFQMGYRSA